MTGEKKRATIVVVMTVSAVLWGAFVLLAIWLSQHDELGWAWFWALVAIAPAGVLYEVWGRRNRGQ